LLASLFVSAVAQSVRTQIALFWNATGRADAGFAGDFARRERQKCRFMALKIVCVLEDKNQSKSLMRQTGQPR
jgi:hypothetical protein